ncbi:glycosyltransferase family 4 protein [Gaetbulibacter saemankumensis]|uniref:glycosyltransferase family 4 protein n=1 Tax=Gaetbulibacter saemankumensis TaxID=311208 RepID=UPI0004809A04|nr:glycosyltransferase family 4 protein [Gaetbulibacter saemankumensis]
MKHRDLNIAIFTPSRNPYSETFIQAHKRYLKGNIFYFYAMGGNIQLENRPPLATFITKAFLKFYEKLFKKGSNYVWETVLLKALKAYKIEAILVEYGTHAHHLRRVLKASGLPVVVHFHGFDASVRPTINGCDSYKEVFEMANKVVAVSRVMEQSLLTLGCPRYKLVYNVYGPQPEFMEVQATFAKKQFVAIGRFVNKKAPYYTILAFISVIEKYPDAMLLMAGQGELYNTCNNLIKYYGIEQNIKLLGVIRPKDYRGLLEESLAFVQHSVTAINGDMEGTPLAVLEASAAGLPVISTRHAGISDVVVHGETGLLCDEHDVETMSKHMLMLLDDVEKAKRMGEKGKKRIQELFSLEHHIDGLQQLLEASV